MKQYHRMAALLLALLTAVSLTACGGSDTSSNEPSAAPVAETPAETTPAAETPAETTPAAETPAETTPAAETPAETASSEEEMSVGQVDGNSYVNTSLGIACDFGENWYLASEEEIAEMNGMMAEQYDNEDLTQILEDTASLTVLYAVDLTTGNTVNIILQDVGLIYGALLSEDEVADAGIEQLEAYGESMGFQNLTLEKATADFAGGQHATIRLSADVAVDAETTAPCYEQQVVYMRGKYVATITFATYYEDTTDELLALFRAAD